MLREVLFDLQDGRCFYCRREVELHPAPWGLGNPAPANFATLEHLRRRADGGRTTRDNCVLACFDCNTKRGDVPWFEYAASKVAA